MANKFFYFCVTLLFLFSISANAAKDGRALAQRVYDRPDGKDSVVAGRMILREPGHKPRNRKTYSFTLDLGNGEVMSLVRFVEPADVNGLGLLTHNYKGDKSDQWLYLPELGKTRRIPSKRKGGRFVGSDLYYEDLRDREVSMDTHKILGTDKVKGLECTLLESIPIDKKNSVYSKRVSCINLQSLLPLRIETYEKGRPSKVFEALKIEKIQSIWTITDQRITDLESKHETRLIADKVLYNQGLEPSLFARQVLEDPVRDESFRPE